MAIFDWIFSKERKKKEDDVVSFVPPTEDGSLVITANNAHLAYSLDIDQNDIRNEANLIHRYRELSLYAEVDRAIGEIIDEAIIYNDDDKSVSIDFSDDFEKKYSKKIQETITTEFNKVLSLLDFNENGSDIFRRWYVDGRIQYHKIIDKDKPQEGIKEVRYIDSTKIRKVIEVHKERASNIDSVELITGKTEYFVYNDKGFAQGEKTGLKISPDAITYVMSGIYDANTGVVLSYLHKAIRPANQLRMMEDATIIYRISRAPERRIFYIDTGDMPRAKAEQYLKEVMARFKNKQVYDAKTGNVKDDKMHLSLMEDYYLPRNSNGKTTEITTLPGGQNLGEMEDVNYFQQKMYESLNVPISRLNPAVNPIGLGRSSEITRDEVKFGRFIGKLRKKFNGLFFDLLKTQLILKDVISEEDWDDIKEHIFVSYSQDNFFTEMKESEILRERASTLQVMQDMVGVYYSREWIANNVLHLTKNEQDDMKKQIEQERKEDPLPGEDDTDINKQGGQ